MGYDTTVVFDETLVYEEDVEALVDRLTASLGRQGRIIWPMASNVLPNMRVYSPGYGFVWYGDLTIKSLELVQALSKEFSNILVVVNEDNCASFYGDHSKKDVASEQWPKGSTKPLARADAVFSKGELIKSRWN